MAVSLPIVSASSDSHSPSSDDGSVSPQTPLSPTNVQPMVLPRPSESQNSLQPQSPTSNPAAAQVKRKPSRRANTAERRATHNAVERQRRETLNGRFLASPFPIALPSDRLKRAFRTLPLYSRISLRSAGHPSLLLSILPLPISMPLVVIAFSLRVNCVYSNLSRMRFAGNSTNGVTAQAFLVSTSL